MLPPTSRRVNSIRHRGPSNTPQPCLPNLPFEPKPFLKLRIADVNALQELIIRSVPSRSLIEIQLHLLQIQPYAQLVRLHELTCRAKRFSDFQQSLSEASERVFFGSVAPELVAQPNP
ncbi:hypothetical protein RHAB21_00839 [Pseudorhizobium halotolerans]|uniref:Phasin protein n=1 Tax=Pseudorhizobium halotolerans TaxID=1233081 RepID=A0ABM8PZ92_9HYPH|nr:hypothetical protein RHAB21_00839 [Pseudorhizobium halotolerans]